MTPALQLQDLDRQAVIQLLDTLQSGFLLVDANDLCTTANQAACRLLGRSSEQLVGTHLPSLFGSCSKACVEQNLHDGGHFFRATLADPESPRTLKGHVTPLQDGRVRAVEFWDDTEGFRLEREAVVIGTMADKLRDSGSLQEATNHLAEEVRRAVGCEAVSIVVYEGSSDVLRFLGSSGLPPGYVDTIMEVWRNGIPPGLRPFIDSEEIVVMHIDELVRQPGMEKMYHFYNKVKWKLLVKVPMKAHGGKKLGGLNCYFTSCRGPDEKGMRFLKSLGHHIAVAVENARLITEAQGKAILEERQRLSRELHDSVSQALYGIALGARTARELADRDPKAIKQPLDYVLTLAEAALEEMRALIFALRPESLESEGLTGALAKQVGALQSRHGLTAHALMCDEPELPLNTKSEIYRLVVEALHNVTKHARASSVELRLERVQADLMLCVSDNGVGFDTSAEFPGHLGLKSMQERAAALGARLQVESAPGQGTRLSLQIPLGV